MMKDKVPGPRAHDLHGLPPCPLNIHCFRLLDEVEGRNNLYQSDSMYVEDDIRDVQLVEQLRHHLPGCPTCQVTLEQARVLRSRQRGALRDLLVEGEQHVPSTASQIFAAIAREQKKSQSISSNHVQLDQYQHLTPLAMPSPPGKLADSSTSLPLRSRTWLRKAFSL